MEKRWFPTMTMAFILSFCAAQTGGHMWMQFRHLPSHRSMVPLTWSWLRFADLFVMGEMTMFSSKQRPASYQPPSVWNSANGMLGGDSGKTHPGHRKARFFLKIHTHFPRLFRICPWIFGTSNKFRISDFLLGSSMCNFCYLPCWFSSLFHMGPGH